MKFKELMNKNLYTEDFEVGRIKDVEIDPEEWRITHLEVELTKEASKSLLGRKLLIRNMLAISALKKGTVCCTDKGVEIKVSKGQLHILNYYGVYIK